MLTTMNLSAKTQRKFAQVASQLSRRLALTGFDAETLGDQIQGRAVEHARALAAYDLRVRFLGGMPPAPVAAAAATGASPSSESAQDGTSSEDCWSGFARQFSALAPLPGFAGPISYDAILDGAGEGAVIDALARSELFVFAGWDRLTRFTEMLEAMLDRAFLHLGDLTPRVFVFDLNDDEQRPRHELYTALQLVRRYQARGHAILSLGPKEALRAAKALGLNAWEAEDLAGRRSGAQRLRLELQVGAVAISGPEGCALARREDAHAVGFNPPEPDLEMAALDAAEAAFNATLGIARLVDLDVEASLECAAYARQQWVSDKRFVARDDFMM